MKARLVVRISPENVGERVTVRSRIDAAPGQATTTDTLGVLRSWEDGVLEIERRDGSVVHLPEADVLAARTLPPAPQRRTPRPPAGDSDA